MDGIATGGNGNSAISGSSQLDGRVQLESQRNSATSGSSQPDERVQPESQRAR